MTHICISKLTIIGSDNGLAPGRRQTIISTNDEILLIGPLGTNFSEILIRIQTISFTKMHLKMSSAKWRPFCLGLNELTCIGLLIYEFLVIIGLDTGLSLVWCQVTARMTCQFLWFSYFTKTSLTFRQFSFIKMHGNIYIFKKIWVFFRDQFNH